jgi:hypothetical protein
MMPDTKETGSDGTELELDDDDGEDTTCPLCEEFEGSASSVQAHISGSTDSDHSGRIGKDVMSEGSDSDSSETIEFPENPDVTDPVDDDELDEEVNPNGDEVSNGSQTDKDGVVEDDDTESGDDLTDVAVAVGAIVALVVFLRGGDFSMEQDPDVPEVMVL